jgi:hypothetical protein
MQSYFKKNGIDFDNVPVWNVEFSLKRKGLKSFKINGNEGVNTVSDLLNVAGSIFKNLMDKYVFLGYDVDKIKRYRKSKNLSRLAPHIIWQRIKESYNRYSVAPVKRVIKYYKSDVNDRLIQNIVVNLNDLSYNLDVSITEVVNIILKQMFYKRSELPGS